jgi:hypothetical protein
MGLASLTTASAAASPSTRSEPGGANVVVDGAWRWPSRPSVARADRASWATQDSSSMSSGSMGACCV